MSTRFPGRGILAFFLLCGPLAGDSAAQQSGEAGADTWWSDPLGLVVLDYIRSNSEARTIPSNLGSSFGIDALINPILQDRGGRELIQGDNLAIETTHAAGYGSVASIYLRDRFQVSRGGDGTGDVEGATVRELFGTVRWGNVRVTAGRSHLFLGQGARAGIILSHNARALDHLRIENARPFRLPGKLSGLGTHSALLFGGDLGPNQNFPHAKLFGFKWSWRPTESLQLALTSTVQMGGEGSPEYSLVDIVDNTFPLTHIFLNRQGEVGNKLGGFEFRVAVPQVAAEFYGEAVWDDIRGFGRFHEAFTETNGYLIGASFSTGSLANSGMLAVEVHRNFPIFYSNSQHTTGWAMDGFLLGDNLGPDAFGLEAWLDQPVSEELQVSLALAYEIRRNDIYNGSASIVKIDDRPDERRIRGTASLHRARVMSNRLAVELELGIEHVRHFAFADSDSRLNYMTRVAVVLQP